MKPRSSESSAEMQANQPKIKLKRAAIYARFSSDRQNERSIDDQVASCRELCARLSFHVVKVFEDRGISGSVAANRPGFQAMLRAAEARQFDVLVTEDLNRLTRGEGEAPQLRRKLEFIGISIVTLADGKVTKIHAGLKGLMDSMYLDTLAQHTRRGLEGVIRSGRSAGGRAYGYRAVLGKPGELEIIEAEADVVRSIFADYISGKSPRAIAGALNARSIGPSRGRHWNASTINGNLARGNGILANEIYIGRIVWNKLHMVKDPETGRRVSRANPKDQYRVAEVPRLRILDDATWTAAHDMKQKRHHLGGPHARTPKRFLSGLLKCAHCGGGMSSTGGTDSGKPRRIRIYCTNSRESGTCTNKKLVFLDTIENLVLDGLRKNLANPAAIAIYVTKYNAERRRLASDGIAKRTRLERRLGEIDRDLKRAADAIIKGSQGAPAALIAAMSALETEGEAVKAELAAIETSPKIVALHPAAIARYESDVARLHDLLRQNGTGDSDQVIAAVRSLIAAVVVHPDSAAPRVDLKGRLAELLDASMFPACSLWPGTMVAGEGLEPPTYGL